MTDSDPGDAQPDVVLDVPEDRVTAWRVEEFLRMGFHETSSHLLATSHADVHKTEQMLAAGCPLTTALRILI